MKTVYAALMALGICVLAAIFEGICAGKNVKSLFATLRFPRYSAPLWIWSIIGAFYYVIFWFVLFRLFRLNTDSLVKPIALTLMMFMMIVNALTNYIIFRAQNLRLSFVVGAFFPLMDVALLLCLLRLDAIAAWSLIPYFFYRIYGVWWGYSLWRANER